MSEIDDYRKVVELVRDAEKATKLLRVVAQTHIGGSFSMAPDHAAEARDLEEIGQEASNTLQSALLLSQWFLGVEITSGFAGISELQVIVMLERVTAKQFPLSRIDECTLTAHSARMSISVKLVFAKAVKRLSETGPVQFDGNLDEIKGMDAGEFSDFVTKFVQAYPSPRLVESQHKAPTVVTLKPVTLKGVNTVAQNANDQNQPNPADTQPQPAPQPVLTDHDLRRLTAAFVRRPEWEQQNQAVLAQIQGLVQTAQGHQGHLEQHDREIGQHQEDLERHDGRLEGLEASRQELLNAQTELTQAQTGLTNTVNGLTQTIETHRIDAERRDHDLEGRIDEVNTIHSRFYNWLRYLALGVLALGAIVIIAGIVMGFLGIGVTMSSANWPWVLLLIMLGIGAIAFIVYGVITGRVNHNDQPDPAA